MSQSCSEYVFNKEVLLWQATDLAERRDKEV